MKSINKLRKSRRTESEAYKQKQITFQKIRQMTKSQISHDFNRLNHVYQASDYSRIQILPGSNGCGTIWPGSQCCGWTQWFGQIQLFLRHSICFERWIFPFATWTKTSFAPWRYLKIVKVCLHSIWRFFYISEFSAKKSWIQKMFTFNLTIFRF